MADKIKPSTYNTQHKYKEGSDHPYKCRNKYTLGHSYSHAFTQDPPYEFLNTYISRRYYHKATELKHSIEHSQRRQIDLDVKAQKEYVKDNAGSNE